MVSDNEMSFKELLLKIFEWLKYILSNWVVILISGIVGAGLGLYYTNINKPVYTAESTFVLEEGGSSNGLGQYAGIASMVGIDLGGGGGGIFQGDNIIELYRSRSMIKKALLSEVEANGEKHLLINYYIDFNKLRRKWAENLVLKNIDFPFENGQVFSRLQDSIISDIISDINQNYLTVTKPDKKLSIIKVEVRAKDELFAKLFNNQIVEKVNDFYLQTKTKKAIENVTVLQNKTDSVRAVLNGAIYSAVAAADATPNSNLTRQVQRIVPMQRSQVTAETNKLILGELVKNLELSKIALYKETPLIQIIDQPVYPLRKEELGRVKGMLLGGFLISSIVILFLLLNRILKNILK